MSIVRELKNKNEVTKCQTKGIEDIWKEKSHKDGEGLILYKVQKKLRRHEMSQRIRYT